MCILTWLGFFSDLRSHYWEVVPTPRRRQMTEAVAAHE